MVKIKKYSLADLERTMSRLSIEEIETIQGGGFSYTIMENGLLLITRTAGSDYTLNALCCGSEFLNLKKPLDVGCELSDCEYLKITSSQRIKGNREIFEWLANHLDYEIGALYNTDDLSGEWMIMTDGQSSYVNLDYTLTGYNGIIHSHPSGTGLYYPQNGNDGSCLDKPDEEVYRNAGKKYGYEDFQLYIPNDKLEKGEGNYQNCTEEVMKMIKEEH